MYVRLISQNKVKMRLQQRDRQLSKMLCVQIVVYMTFTISYPLNTLYNAVSFDHWRNERLLKILSYLLLLNFYSAASFFVFLTSSAFRRKLRKIFACILGRIQHLYVTSEKSKT